MMVITVNFENLRTDFKHTCPECDDHKDIDYKTLKEGDFSYQTVLFSKTVSHQKLISIIEDEISKFFMEKDIPKCGHIFVVGIGNDSHTADSVGPRSLKYLHVNSHLLALGIDLSGFVVSSLAPGVQGETGIDTTRLIDCIKKEIKPDCMIIVDSFVTDDAHAIGRTLYITDEGLTPGSGLMGNNGAISFENTGIPVLTIGIPTAVEISLENKKKETHKYLLSPSDIDIYVREISEIIGLGIDAALQAK